MEPISIRNSHLFSTVCVLEYAGGTRGKWASFALILSSQSLSLCLTILLSLSLALSHSFSPRMHGESAWTDFSQLILPSVTAPRTLRPPPPSLLLFLFKVVVVVVVVHAVVVKNMYLSLSIPNVCTYDLFTSVSQCNFHSQCIYVHIQRIPLSRKSKRKEERGRSCWESYILREVAVAWSSRKSSSLFLTIQWTREYLVEGD